MTITPTILAPVSIPERGTIHFFIEDLCHTIPLAFIRVLSIAVIGGSARTYVTNRYSNCWYPFFYFCRYGLQTLSNVRLLHGMDTKSQAIASLMLYWQQSIIRKVCKALFESILNHNLTTKCLTITVIGEYTYGLPPFLLGAVGHGIQPIRYRT